MGWFQDQWDSLRGKTDEREAKQNAQVSEQQQREAAARARDIAIEANRQALEPQLAAADAQKQVLYNTGVGTSGILDTTFNQLAPLYGASSGALSQLAALSGVGSPEAIAAARSGFETSPGYNFRQSEGEKAIRRLASARGQLGSGAMYKDLLKYNQGLATDEYGRYIGQLSNLASMFPTQAVYGLGSTKAQIGSQLGNTVAGIEGQIGDARSSTYLGEGAARAGYETTAGQLLAQLASDKTAAMGLSSVGKGLGAIKDIVDLGGTFFGKPPTRGGAASQLGAGADTNNANLLGYFS